MMMFAMLTRIPKRTMVYVCGKNQKTKKMMIKAKPELYTWPYILIYFQKIV